MTGLRSAATRITRSLSRRAGAGAEDGSDRGSAIVEFLGVALVLLVPVVYLVLVLAQMQSAAFAVDGAAREAARTFVTTQDVAVAPSRAATAVAIAFEDQGLDPRAAPDAVTIDCSADPCLAPGTVVTATVELDVTLPGVPRWLDSVVPLSVPVSATATATVDAFAGGG